MSKKYVVLFISLICAFYLGCGIHQQSPVKEVPYDFSDHYYYDRAYAPSPQYLNDAGSDKLDGGDKADDSTKIKVQIIVEKTK